MRILQGQECKKFKTGCLIFCFICVTLKETFFWIGDDDMTEQELQIHLRSLSLGQIRSNINKLNNKQQDLDHKYQIALDEINSQLNRDFSSKINNRELTTRAQKKLKKVLASFGSNASNLSVLYKESLLEKIKEDMRKEMPQSLQVDGIRERKFLLTRKNSLDELYKKSTKRINTTLSLFQNEFSARNKEDVLKKKENVKRKDLKDLWNQVQQKGSRTQKSFITSGPAFGM